MSTTDLSREPDGPSPDEYLAIQASPEFADLRRTLRRFVFPLTAFFLAWYGIYLLLGVLATDFMGAKLWGDINVGLVLGLGQFLSTFVITFLYVRFANRDLDPNAAKVRELITGGAVERGEGGGDR